MRTRYYLVIFDKGHVKLTDTCLNEITDYPFSKQFVYFVFKTNNYGYFVPICKVEKGIIDMTFTCSYNFYNFVNDL